MGKSSKLVYTLSKKLIYALFIYYFLLLLCGGLVSIKIACNLMSDLSAVQVLQATFIVSIADSGMLCSVQYIRRLYKACLAERINIEKNTIKCIGNMAYFVFRPFFAFVFSVVMVFALMSGMFVVTGNFDYVLNEKFVYLSAILSSFLGYSIGKLLDKFESVSEEKIDNLKLSI